MRLGQWIDRVIEPFAPNLVRRREAERTALQLQRQYDAAGYGRRTQNWKRTNGSADREIKQGLKGSRNGVRELVRNTKYAANTLEHMVAATIGDGIAVRLTHPVEAVQKKAQEKWDTWAQSAVDGWQDFYGAQELVFSGVVEGGDMLVAWEPDDNGPDGFIRILEGDYLDEGKNEELADGGRIVQGVQYNGRNHRVGYWLFPYHPGDAGGMWGRSVFHSVEDVDHVFRQRRASQSRGISWFAPYAVGFRDIDDTEQARMLKEKIASCLALVLTPPDNAGPTSPFDEAATTAPSASGDRLPDTVRPGMIFRARAGETATAVNPPAGGDTTSFIKQQVAASTAALSPYHLVTGDVTDSSYTSLRAARLGELQLLDGRQQNVMIPLMVAKAVKRRMRRLALETGDKRFLEVKSKYAPPIRRVTDPIKDTAGEKAEIRAGLKSVPKALSERGIDPVEHAAEIKAWQQTTDAAGLVFDTDARRVDGSGGLQPPAGYIAPKGASEEN